MPASTQNWELGVVAFYDPFQEYDRPTQLAAQFLGKDAAVDWGDRVSLDTSVCSDYGKAPFYLKPRLGKNGGADPYVPGSEIIIGPSTNATYSGSIERATVALLDQQTAPYLQKSFSGTYVAWPSSTCEIGDQVIIRTVPLGWTAGGASGDFANSVYGVCPVRRFDKRQSPILLAGESYPGLSDYFYEYTRAMRLYTNTGDSEDTDAKVSRASDVNTYNPAIRRWRASWQYRISRAVVNSDSPSNIHAVVNIGLMTADGEYVVLEGTNSTAEMAGTELGNVEDNSYKVRAKVASYLGVTTDWVTEEKFLSHYDTSNAYNFNPTSSVLFNASNRGNRFGVEVGLYKGINTAFDINDFVIEHADGTSQAENGYYSIADFPDPETINPQPINTLKRNRLANGSLRQITTDTGERPKIILSAEFRDVAVGIYNDLLVLENWVKKGRLIALRPKINGLPPVMVGVIRIVRSPSSHWSLGMVTFTLEFEEA